MKVDWKTILVRANTMTSSDYDALAYVVKNCASSTRDQIVKATGLSRYKLDAMMRTFVSRNTMACMRWLANLLLT